MWLVVANFLVSDHLFLRSGHSQVMMFMQISTKQTLLSVLTRKNKISRFSFHPLRSRPWLKIAGLCGASYPAGSIGPSISLGPLACAQAWLMRQISAGSTLGARSPDPAQPSSLRKHSAQDPASPQAFHLN